MNQQEREKQQHRRRAKKRTARRRRLAKDHPPKPVRIARRNKEWAKKMLDKKESGKGGAL